MKTLARSFAALAALTIATGALAEAHEDASEMPPVIHFEMEGTISDTMLVGGVGGEVFAASWTETLTFSAGDNTSAVTAKCAGMDMPDGNMFDRHFTCTLEDTNGQSGAVLYGCAIANEAGNEMRCYGHFEGMEGEVKDHAALHTAYYTFMPDGTGKVVGSGQWYK
ncbi:hypothetical protein NAP1_14563 [Erythrobacter sp. NAP1]|uniref:hypothetical protein n=1 Tax=Erythrobacter sp. NAP1 TaxID=237727 RepID=UPI00006877E0|nr:hypothetical protein [Erythrobacter sp. NAP1]EAQ28830.1 hypothetical protein NAP1_14563 [Erythrobacter sp. NAP1]